MYRKTRFVCVSDTHGYTPSEAGFRLPTGDVLIHAGDLTNQGSKSELRKTMDWIAAADFEVKIVICGNHDITLDTPFYKLHGPKIHNKQIQSPSECIDIVTNASPSVVFLQHQSALVRLRRPNGPNTVFKVFGSPYSQCGGSWAFLYESDEAESLWKQIPLDADVVVTHMPPHLHCDRASGVSMGCLGLKSRLQMVRPCLAVCGHIHESRGFERVRWASVSKEGEQEGKNVEDQVVKGVLPPQGSKKQSLVDLTGKRASKLDNCGFSGAKASFSSLDSHQDVVLLPPQASKEGHGLSASDKTQSEAQKTDTEGLQAQRRETCVVNAAVMASNWPHRGGRKFYPGPIIVDLELPVWTE